MSNDWQSERDRRGGQFVAGLIAEFQILDHDELTDALHLAEQAYELELLLGRGREWSLRWADALDELDAPLWKTVELMHELNGPLAEGIAGGYNEEFEKKQDELLALTNRLADVGRAAARIPRQRPRRGDHHLHHKPIRAIMGVLVNYWTRILGREFKQDQKAWAPDQSGRLIPSKPEAMRFAFKVVEHIAPGQGKALRTIARDFVGYGKSSTKETDFL